MAHDENHKVLRHTHLGYSSTLIVRTMLNTRQNVVRLDRSIVSLSNQHYLINTHKTCKKK